MKRIITVISVVAAMAIIFLATANKNTAAKGAEKAAAITFALLAKTTLSDNPPPIFPAELLKLEGKRVRISGFMAPYGDPEKLDKIMLLETPGGCFYCNPPDANAVVFVRRSPKDAELKYDTEPVAFEGTLHLFKTEMKDDDDAKRFLFTIDDAKVVKP